MMGGEAIVNERATEGIFKERAPQYGLIHVATHGRMDPRVPLRSSLFFHADPSTHDDGELHAYEIYGMDLQAELAVLSACSVGGGKSIKGQGVMSLGRSFMVAGCTNVVMTLQDVSDQKASEIMRRFYVALVGGKTVAEALQLARMQYISETDAEYAHPAYWSPFILVGPGDIGFVTLAAPRKTWPYWLGACGVIVGLILTWWLLRRRNLNT
jgi:CHAT domain-containing protein